MTVAEEQIVSWGNAIVEAFKLIIAGGIGGTIVGGIAKLVVDRKLAEQQAGYDQQLEALKSKLEKKRIIHKLQFEKEFKIYLELWTALVKLRRVCALLMPISEFGVNTNETVDERKQRKAKDFGDAYNALIPIVENNRPFYAPEVYEKAARLISSAWQQGMSVIYVYYGIETTSQDYQNVKAKVDEITAIVNEIEAVIRNRIGLIGNAELVV